MLAVPAHRTRYPSSRKEQRYATMVRPARHVREQLIARPAITAIFTAVQELAIPATNLASPAAVRTPIPAA